MKKCYPSPRSKVLPMFRVAQTRRTRLQQLIKRANATPFQKKVWRALLTIPKGEVRSYSWVAGKAGFPKAIRAVGNALNKNPFAPAVPCHRVIRKDGSLGGFAKGTARKRDLLKREGYRIA